jgi:hypothetical protein
MKPNARLLDSAASELELRLLRAGASEEPPAGALQRMADTLGVRVAESASHAPEVIATASSAASAAGAKLALVVAVGLAIAGGSWLATRPAEPGSEPRAGAPAPARSLETPAPAPPTAAPAAPLATLQPADDTAAKALSEEIARLDAVRRLLATRRARPAIDALSGYERDYPAGALRQEAALLRIEAHRRAGDRGRARALAERFLAENPGSPHAARVRSLGHVR